MVSEVDLLENWKTLEVFMLIDIEYRGLQGARTVVVSKEHLTVSI